MASKQRIDIDNHLYAHMLGILSCHKASHTCIKHPYLFLFYLLTTIQAMQFFAYLPYKVPKPANFKNQNVKVEKNFFLYMTRGYRIFRTKKKASHKTFFQKIEKSC